MKKYTNMNSFGRDFLIYWCIYNHEKSVILFVQEDNII
jgi:hypothetical protein